MDARGIGRGKSADGGTRSAAGSKGLLRGEHTRWGEIYVLWRGSVFPGHSDLITRPCRTAPVSQINVEGSTADEPGLRNRTKRLHIVHHTSHITGGVIHIHMWTSGNMSCFRTVHSLLRLKLPSSTNLLPPSRGAFWPQLFLRHALLCGVAEGGLSYIAPVPDSEMAQRLQALQEHMSRRLPHVAGLNPRAFR